MNFWQAYTADKEAETIGKWFDFEGGLQLRIARADLDANSQYAAAYQELLSDVDASDENGVANAMRKLYARSIVTDARVNNAECLINEAGETVEFSAQFIENMFIKLPELFRQVRVHANNFDNFRAKADQAVEDLGKS